jgi:hypothetical protein
LDSTGFLETGLAADFVFVPAVFALFALAADVTALGFLGITVNSSSFPQWGHFAMCFSLDLVEEPGFNRFFRGLFQNWPGFGTSPDIFYYYRHNRACLQADHSVPMR